jgi:hypothetical protein
VYDVGEEDQRLVLYALLLAEAQHEDLERFVHRESLVGIWPRLRRLLGPHARHPHNPLFRSSFPDMRTDSTTFPGAPPFLIRVGLGGPSLVLRLSWSCSPVRAVTIRRRGRGW